MTVSEGFKSSLALIESQFGKMPKAYFFLKEPELKTNLIEICYVTKLARFLIHSVLNL